MTAPALLALGWDGVRTEAPVRGLMAPQRPMQHPTTTPAPGASPSLMCKLCHELLRLLLVLKLRGGPCVAPGEGVAAREKGGKGAAATVPHSSPSRWECAIGFGWVSGGPQAPSACPPAAVACAAAWPVLPGMAWEDGGSGLQLVCCDTLCTSVCGASSTTAAMPSSGLCAGTASSTSCCAASNLSASAPRLPVQCMHASTAGQHMRKAVCVRARARVCVCARLRARQRTCGAASHDGYHKKNSQRLLSLLLRSSHGYSMNCQGGVITSFGGMGWPILLGINAMFPVSFSFKVHHRPT